MQLITQNHTDPIVFQLFSSSDGKTELTGASPTVTISQDGGSLVAPVGVVSEIGYGFYKLSPAGTDTATVGPLRLRAVASGANNAYADCQVIDPTAAPTAFLDLANGIEAGLTLRQAMRVMAAALAGVLGGGAGTNIAIAAAGNPATPRIAATVDGAGNRTTVTLTP